MSSNTNVVGGGAKDDNVDADNNKALTMAESSYNDDEDKAHSFRRRRLSLDNLRQLDAEAEANRGEVGPTTNVVNEGGEDDEQAQEELIAEMSPVQDEKAHSFRKRRLSLIQNREESASTGDADEVHSDVGRNNDHNTSKRRRRNSDASASTMDSHGNSSSNANPPRNLKSRTLHAAELLAQPPPSPATTSTLPKLYQQAAPPQNLPLLDTLGDGNHDGTHSGPKWKKRHTRLASDDRNLPFPRDVVGTFSCHGVEPIYDSDFQPDIDEDYDDNDDEDEWVVGGANSSTGGKHLGVYTNPTKASVALEKPTMAAKINQDRGGVVCPYGNSAKTALFAVYDGHGQGGELVSQYALHEVQRLLEKHPDFNINIGKAFRETFVKVDSSLADECLIEPLYAGTTACVALLRDKRLTLSNAGDSRAVLARKVGGGRWEAIDLTVDQNPDLPAEQERILRMGGFVSPPPEPGLSARVWLDKECTQIGLAMARSIGDHAVKSIGVIAEPVISYHDIEEDDDFVILATDGVWEFISSEEAVEIVGDHLHKGATKACRSLIEAAAARWHDEEGDYRDDITALVIRLQHLWAQDSSNGMTEKTS